MATVHVLRNKLGDTLVFTIGGKTLVTGEGDRRVAQTFPSPAAAAEHLERVISLRKRDGFSVAEVRELAAAPPPAGEPDALAGIVKLDAERRRMRVVLRGAKVPRGLSALLVERIARDTPRSVQIVCDPAAPGKELAAALRAAPQPSVEAFIFDTESQTLARQAANAFGDLSDVLRALPSVERVFVTGDLSLSPVDHAKLGALYLLGDPLKQALFDGLARCRFPELATLALALCSDRGPGPDAAVTGALQALDAPRLSTVQIDALADVTAALDALARGPLPPSWRVLCLGGLLDDEDALLATLKRRKKALSGLTSLGLPLEDCLTDDAIAKVKALMPNVVDSEELSEPLLPAIYEAW